jgi:hypothetical protein
VFSSESADVATRSLCDFRNSRYTVSRIDALTLPLCLSHERAALNFLHLGAMRYIRTTMLSNPAFPVDSVLVVFRVLFYITDRAHVIDNGGHSYRCDETRDFADMTYIVVQDLL